MFNIFVRDEVVAWQATAPQRPSNAQNEPTMRERVLQNVELVMSRVRNLACLPAPDRVRRMPWIPRSAVGKAMGMDADHRGT